MTSPLSGYIFFSSNSIESTAHNALESIIGMLNSCEISKASGYGPASKRAELYGGSP